MAIAFTETQQPDTALLYDLYKSMGLETGGIDNALFSLKAADGNILAGGATLSERYGVAVLDYVAVIPEYRNINIGKALVEKVLEKAGELNFDEVFFVTKVEGFFKKLGAVPTDEHKELISECIGCRQYMAECRPVLMKMKVN